MCIVSLAFTDLSKKREIFEEISKPLVFIESNKSQNAAVAKPYQTLLKKPAKFVNKVAPTKRHRESVDVSSIPIEDYSLEWKCPNVTGSRSLECSCDLPHTLRCNGDVHGLTVSAI